MTYSIVARDPESGRLGVAVQSHWFSVGSVVSWAEAGVGAVATQSFAERSYGPLGLELMRRGRSAPDALQTLLHADAEREARQVAFVDANGDVGVHSGDACIREFGHVAGEGFSVQANLMERDTVWGAMADAYRTADGDLADRMLAALTAAQAEGGDIRGTQSAASWASAPMCSGDSHRLGVRLNCTRPSIVRRVSVPKRWTTSGVRSKAASASRFITRCTPKESRNPSRSM